MRDNCEGRITSSTQLPLYEIKVGQWRGGVWRDPKTGVHWLVVAGLAKGNHEDRDDVYEIVRRANDAEGWTLWLPTQEDERLLKRETAARLLTEWELLVQRRVWEALVEVEAGGSKRFDVDHPVAAMGRLAAIDLTVVPVRDPDYQADDVVVEVSADEMRGSDLVWQLTTRILISLNPPEHGWDRFGDTYSNIAEPGAWKERAEELASLVDNRQLAESEPGRLSHYAHTQHIAQCSVEGLALRAACGVFFVPTQDHESMPICPACSEHLDALPK